METTNIMGKSMFFLGDVGEEFVILDTVGHECFRHHEKSVAMEWAQDRIFDYALAEPIPSEADRSSGLVPSYPPLDLLNPHTCTDSDLRALATKADCPPVVRGYILGVLDGRLHKSMGDRQ